MKYIFSITFLALFFTFSAQTSPAHIIDKDNCRDGENVEYCKTHKVMNEMKKKPDFLKSFIKDQRFLKKIEDSISNSSRAKVVYTIPIVFHVLYYGSQGNISDAQIEDQMEILNRDFRKQNQDANGVQSVFSGMPADIEIEFALATKAPDGPHQCFNGITRTSNAITNNGSNGNAQVSAIISGNDVYNGTWPGNKYLNVFVVNDADGAAGYTYNPSNHPSLGTSMYNGIWILHDYVGSIGSSSSNRSRALTHEVGHWLNLEHTWGPNNNPGNTSSCSDDDGVSDTPRCIGVNSCNLTSNTCSNDNNYWGFDIVDNVENYMDYSYCTKMFSNGQKNRMRAAIFSNTGGRNNLWTSSNHSYTGINSNNTATVGMSIPYFEGFENTSNISNSDWSITNDNSSGPEFQITNSASSSGTKSVMLDNSQGITGNQDELISGALNLAHLTSVSLTFKYAFAKRSNNNTDVLKIYASKDCGATWFLRKNISSASIATMANTTAPYTPVGNDWKTISVPGISSSYLVSDFRFKFSFTNGGGNDLYIDDINLSGVMSLDENESLYDLIVYPNPTLDKATVSFYAPNNINDGIISLMDAYGRLIKVISSKDFIQGENQIEFSTAELDKGWYMINFESQNRSRTLKLIKN